MLTTSRIIDRYWVFFGCVLFGYALGGKGFAYVGFPPIFIGEITMIFGLFCFMILPGTQRVFNSGIMWLLILFMSWGAFCTFPYLGKYGINAIRDGMIWGYAFYAFIVFGLIAAQPQRLVRIVNAYRKSFFWFLLAAPGVFAIAKMFEYQLPTWPWAPTVQMINVKGGDLVCHFTGVMAFLSVFDGIPRAGLSMVLLTLNMALNVLGRSALVTFSSGLFIVNFLRPLNKFGLRLFAVIALALSIMWATQIKVGFNDGTERDISFDQLIRNVESIFSNKKTEGDLSGTKEWRLRWWNTIIKYTFDGPYFWSGKGFGINLADDDKFQVDEGGLRSPHNAHMTFLARAGVPGLVFWAGVNLAWAIAMLNEYVRSVRSNRKDWSAVFLWLMAYWLAFMANASFDVFLEGPVGGVWFWSIFGAGLAAMSISKRYPTIFDDYRDENELFAQEQAAAHSFPVLPPRTQEPSVRR